MEHQRRLAAQIIVEETEWLLTLAQTTHNQFLSFLLETVLEEAQATLASQGGDDGLDNPGSLALARLQQSGTRRSH